MLCFVFYQVFYKALGFNSKLFSLVDLFALYLAIKFESLILEIRII